MSANISDGSSHRSHEDLLLTETVFAKTLDCHGNTPSDRLNQRLLMADGLLKAMDLITPAADSRRQRIAIVSLLFNWPSTGGGIVHTAELAHFLSAAGYEVCHFFAVYEPWSIGSIREPLPYNACGLIFTDDLWNRDAIEARFREAIRGFAPDATIVTDSWNSKAILARAVSEFPYYIRLAAMECLCPLNNVRLLVDGGGRIHQCRKSQLSTRNACLNCVEQNAGLSGQLHSDERQLAGFSEPEFGVELQSVFADAAGILVVNPLIGALCEPYARDVHVIPSGFDRKRFENLPERRGPRLKTRILFAGLISEFMKGFHVIFEACAELWVERNDFELVATADPVDRSAPFLTFAGWKSQEDLPGLMATCDLVVVPTVAQEALGRTAVEAMGASKPVVASRIGGLPFTVVEGVTGLLFEPGNAQELCLCLKQLLDDPRLAESLGRNGRERFLTFHTWDQILESHYRPLFSALRSAQ